MRDDSDGDRPLCRESGKVQYSSRHAAQKAVRALQSRRKAGARMHSYQCPACHCWHVGHAKG